MSHLDSFDYRTLVHFETVHFKWALSHRTWRRFWTMITYGFFFCITEVYLAFADGTVDCVYWQWFLNVFLSLFSNFNDRIMQMSDAVSSEGRRARTSYKGLRPYPLSTEICPVYFNLLMMLCTVDNEICKAFAIWRWGKLFLKYSIFLHTLSQIGEPSAHLYLWETLPL